MATRRNPFCSKRLMISPTRPRCTPSGLMAMKVRSAWAMVLRAAGAVRASRPRSHRPRGGPDPGPEATWLPRPPAATAGTRGLRDASALPAPRRSPSAVPGCPRRTLVRGPGGAPGLRDRGGPRAGRDWSRRLTGKRAGAGSDAGLSRELSDRHRRREPAEEGPAAATPRTALHPTREAGRFRTTLSTPRVCRISQRGLQRQEVISTPPGCARSRTARVQSNSCLQYLLTRAHANLYWS